MRSSCGRATVPARPSPTPARREAAPRPGAELLAEQLHDDLAGPRAGRRSRRRRSAARPRGAARRRRSGPSPTARSARPGRGCARWCRRCARCAPSGWPPGRCRSSTALRSALQPGSNSMVVMPQVEWATKTVQIPSVMPALSIAFCACAGEVDDLAVALRVERQLLIPCLHDPPVAPARSAPMPDADERSFYGRLHAEGIFRAAGAVSGERSGRPAPARGAPGPPARRRRRGAAGARARAVPGSLRQLRGFHARAMARGAARQQLRTAMETDDDFRKQVVEHFLDQPEVRAALDGWDAASRTAAHRRGRGPIGPPAARLRARRRAPDGLDVRPRVSRRRRSTGRAGCTKPTTRSPRSSSAWHKLTRRAAGPTKRRPRPKIGAAAPRPRAAGGTGRPSGSATTRPSARSTRAQRQVDEAMAEGARLQRAAEAAERARTAHRDRLRTIEAELRAAREAASGPEVTLRDDDLQALVDAAALAARLSKGLGGVADRVQTLRNPKSPTASLERAQRRPTAARSRAGFRVPPGLSVDAPEAVESMLRTPGAVLVVDGYNVTKRAWPDGQPRGAAGPVGERDHRGARAHALRCDRRVRRG